MEESDDPKRSPVDTLAEQQALAALDELIAKVDSGPELSGSSAAPSAMAEEPPPEAYALTGDVPALDGWYVAMKDGAQGPFTVEDLKELWSRGEIGADSLCWREGMGEWRALSRLHGLTAAISPRPREGLRSLSARPPVVQPTTQPGFAPSASNMLRSLAEQEAKSEKEAKAAPRPPPTSPTTPSGPKKVVPPPPAVVAEVRAPVTYEEREEEEPSARPAGVSGARLFLSLFAASVLGGVVGGGLVKMTIPPPPEPVVVDEPPLAAVAQPAPPPIKVEVPPKAEAAPPPKPPKAEAPKVETPKRETPKAEAKPEPKAKPPPPPPEPKTPVDKDFQDLFGK